MITSRTFLRWVGEIVNVASVFNGQELNYYYYYYYNRSRCEINNNKLLLLLLSVYSRHLKLNDHDSSPVGSQTSASTSSYYYYCVSTFISYRRFLYRGIPYLNYNSINFLGDDCAETILATSQTERIHFLNDIVAGDGTKQ